MGKNFKRFLSLMMVLATVLSFVPATVSAAEGEEPVCAIGDVEYATLTEAVTAAGSDETTIKLLVPTLTERVTIGYSYRIPQNITIDLNGGTLTSNDVTLSANNNSVLTVVNGTVYGNSNTGGTIRATGGGKVVLGDGVVITCGPWASGLVVNNGSLEIKGNVQVTANTKNGKNWLNTSANSNNEVTVTGGTFVGGMSFGEGTQVQLSGGMYTVKPQQEWVAPGCTVAAYGKDMWTIAPPDGVITVDGVWYNGWDEAEEGIKKDSTIILYGDVSNTGDCKAMQKKGNLTLDLNGHTLSTPSKGTNTIWVSENTVLNVIDSIGGGKIAMGSYSYPLTAYIGGKICFADGIQFIGSLQSTNGSGTFCFADKELIGPNGIYQTNGTTTRIEVNEAGDWTISLGNLTLSADDATLANNTMTIGAAKVLDLNGHNLTVKSLVGNGNVIDTTDGEGSITTGSLSFNNHANGGYLPIQDGEAYRLFYASVVNGGAKSVTYQGKKAAKFGGRIEFTNAKAYELLQRADLEGLLKLDVSITGSDEDEKIFLASASNMASYLRYAYGRAVSNQAIKQMIAFTVSSDKAGSMATGDVVTGSFSVVLEDLGIVMTSAEYTHKVG